MGRCNHALQSCQKSGLRKHEMIGGKDQNCRLGVLQVNMCKWKEDAGSGAAVAWLQNCLFPVNTLQTVPHIRSMLSGDHHQRAVHARKHHGAIQSVLQHRPVADEGAILFGSVLAQPPLCKHPKAFAFAAGQHYGPGVWQQRVGCGSFGGKFCDLERGRQLRCCTAPVFHKWFSAISDGRSDRSKSN